MEMDPGPHATATAGLRASLDSGELILLIQSVAGGRPQALADLYDRTSRQVFALAYRVLKDRQVAEEVVLDVFLQVWRSAQGYDVARARPLGWLFTIARSRALDALRARRVRVRREDELAPGHPEVEPAPTPPERLDLTDRQGRVRRALAELPADQKLAVHLAYFEGLSHTEIAQRTGASLGTVKTRLRLGMQKLRAKLTRFEDQP
jgi:RNA polymerase sigma-70 factor (ECF subfamily)